MSVINLLKAAFQYRASHLCAKTTNVYRVFDAEADGLKDLFIDSFDGHCLVQAPSHFPDEILEFDQWKSVYFKKLDKADKKSPEWVAGEKVPEYFQVQEGPASYWVSFNHGYSQGFFIDQRDNRALIANLSSKKKLLNLFSYTCSFSVRAALEGASTVNVDLSTPSLEWGKRNFELNKIDFNDHIFWRGDARDYLKKAHKRGEKFDVIVVDPPSFSRDKKSGTFQLEKEFESLIEAAFKVLSFDGTIFFSTNLHKHEQKFFEVPLKKLAQQRKYRCLSLPLTWDFRRPEQLKAFMFEKC